MPVACQELGLIVRGLRESHAAKEPLGEARHETCQAGGEQRVELGPEQLPELVVEVADVHLHALTVRGFGYALQLRQRNRWQVRPRERHVDELDPESHRYSVWLLASSSLSVNNAHPTGGYLHDRFESTAEAVVGRVCQALDSANLSLPACPAATPTTLRTRRSP